MYELLQRKQPVTVAVCQPQIKTRVGQQLELKLLSVLPLHNTKIGQEPGGAVTRRYELLLILKISNFYLLFYTKSNTNKTNLFVSKICFFFLENWEPRRNDEWRERDVTFFSIERRMGPI